jgi:pilus assembly protein Flp/PilA
VCPRQTATVRRRGARKKEFTRMKALLRNLVVREEGQDLVEYALLAALLSIVSIAALTLLGPVIANVWTRINAAISSV